MTLSFDSKVDLVREYGLQHGISIEIIDHAIMMAQQSLHQDGEITIGSNEQLGAMAAILAGHVFPLLK